MNLTHLSPAQLAEMSLDALHEREEALKREQRLLKAQMKQASYSLIFVTDELSETLKEIGPRALRQVGRPSETGLSVKALGRKQYLAEWRARQKGERA